MKTTTLWIIRLALVVQFLGVLAVPLFAQKQVARGTWMAEWLRPNVVERTIGVLRLQDGKLFFTEQAGQAHWEVELTAIKRVATTNGGKALLIVTVKGEEYVTSIMRPSLMPQSPHRALDVIEKALQQQALESR